MEKKYILDGKQADLKIKRMALQILEDHVGVAEVILAGVAPNGSLIANRIKEILSPLTDSKILVQEISLDKKHPLDVKVVPELDMNFKSLVIVDDVANSGRTLTYAIKPYLASYPDSIKTLVLVDRTHKKFPIQPDYVGFSLASTLQEYIDLDVENGEIKGAWMV